MKRITLIALAAGLLFSTSCVKQSAEYKALKAQNDSLLNVKHKMQDELDEYFSALNQIEQNIEKIKSTESSVSVSPVGHEVTGDKKNKINEDLQYLNDMLQSNKEELSKLKSKLKKSSLHSSELESTITRLTRSLEEESKKVAALQEELTKKDAVISDLNNTVEEKNKNIQRLSDDNTVKESKIKEQDDAIHSAWYAFGTKKELKQQRIITSDGLFSTQKVLQKDFNKDFFVRVDLRNTKSIPLYSTHAKILTNHPKSSYTLQKENGNFVLLITQPEEFWSVSKYLVIQVD